MNNLLLPDPPGTINPAKLSADTWTAPNGPSGDFDIPRSAAASLDTKISVENSAQNIRLALSAPVITASALPRLARISSDWDPQDDIVSTSREEHSELRKEFEERFTEKLHLSTRRTKHLSHHGYFRRQTAAGANIFVDLDPDEDPDTFVVIDGPTASIYDAFLLQADITLNLNIFYRQQIVFNPCTKRYAFLTREGRVGLPLQAGQKIEANDLKSLSAKFRRVFRQKTGLAWKERHERCPPQRSGQNGFNFIELDYRLSSARQLGNHLNYESVDASIPSELRELMETILYGSPARGDAEKEPQDTVKSGTRLRFSTPFMQLSAWAVFLAFKTLQRIARYIESSRAISWKSILRASSLYRSQIPFCAGHNRVPVISCYHSIFLELKFLHSLWPRPEIANMLTDIYLRGSLQLRAHKMLAQPLYRAYSSLRHGFRRLTDPCALEFQELKKYLERSCHTLHRLRIELQDIYSVFIKAGLPNLYRDWIEENQGQDVSGAERLLLWHGTALDSLLGILELGLQIRRRGFSWTGTMFGNGIYLADASSKSATFCKYQRSEGDAVLLLCEANVGRQRCRCVHSMETAHDIIGAPGSQYRCVQGLGRIGPGAWRDVGWDMCGAPSSAAVRMPDTSVPYGETYSGGTLGFNEYVVYNPSHVLIRYIFRIKMNGRRIYSSADMISYTGNINTVTLTAAGFGGRSGNDQGLTIFEEAPLLYKRGGKYYMVFAASCCSEHLGWSAGPSATGPWTYGGVIMPAQGSSFTNQEGAPQVDTLDPYVRQEAETIAWSFGVQTEACSEGGMDVLFINNGDYIKVKGVAFGAGASTFNARVSSGSSGGQIELRLGSVSGTLVGTCKVSGTGGWQ